MAHLSVAEDMAIELNNKEPNMAMRYNPSLSEEPRNRAIPVIVRKTEESILGWLEQTGRLLPREPNELHDKVDSNDWDESLDMAKYDPEAREKNTEE